MHHSDLVNDSDMFLCHDPAELNFVEVWEDRGPGSDGQYRLWDKENGGFYVLVHGPHKDFMDAAVAFEDALIEASERTRAIEMRAERFANPNSRSLLRMGAGAPRQTIR